ncbi:MAG: CoA transferase [Pseudomonadales bacterium]|jgi:crotonobetainyl-CoA:carnitine CoA-transferase CaiB-like acyl-CoA transferase|nr:CoA transferase [Gammaproteobacteria bacterium]MCH1597308.1 CoA transferase [Pseudomonadales bacterium]RPG30801.1 MAG: CoA transferase [Gammaproteobacteria bacterium TMED243]
MESKRKGPLEDLTIIDCTRALAGPFGAGLLADMGARVIKVEPPSGDGYRNIPPFLPDHAKPHEELDAGTDFGAPFAAVNRNKRSVCLDLKNEADKTVFLQLCDQADAVLENLRAGVMDRLGLGYEVIAERNPKIVYACVRGFGDPRTGESPYAHWPSLDAAAQSFGGLVHANDGLVTPAIADIFPGTLMALGVVSAIHSAQRSGRGQFLDVGMYDAMLAFQKSAVAQYGFTGKPNPAGLQRAMTLYPFDLFPAKDGRIAIAVGQPRHWDLLCAAMERPDLMDDERSFSNEARLANVDWVEEQICGWTRNLSRRDIMIKLDGAIPVGPVQTMEDVYIDPHVSARGMLETCEPAGDNPPISLAASPIKFLDTPTSLYQRPPNLGEHNAEVLAEFGIEVPVPKDH